MPKLKDMESCDNHLLKTSYPLFIKRYLSEDLVSTFLPLLNVKLCSVCPQGTLPLSHPDCAAVAMPS